MLFATYLHMVKDAFSSVYYFIYVQWPAQFHQYIGSHKQSAQSKQQVMLIQVYAGLILQKKAGL